MLINKISRITLLLFLLSADWALADTEKSQISLKFRLVAEDQPVTCGQAIHRLGTRQTSARLKDARLYIHNIELKGKGDVWLPLSLEENEWQTSGLALLDFETGGEACVGDAPTHTQVTGTLGDKPVTGLRFTVGVPIKGIGTNGQAILMNHSNPETAPAPLDIQSMAWNWQAGRKFMKIELAPDGGIQRPQQGKSAIWTVHLGSTACKGNPGNGDEIQCGRSNRVNVTLADFDPAKDVVLLDLAALFSQVDLSRDEGGASGCMSSVQDPECAGIFSALGIPLSGDTIAPPSENHVFRRGGQ